MWGGMRVTIDSVESTTHIHTYVNPHIHSPIGKAPFLEGSKGFDLRGAFPDFDFQVRTNTARSCIAPVVAAVVGFERPNKERVERRAASHASAPTHTAPPKIKTHRRTTSAWTRWSRCGCGSPRARRARTRGPCPCMARCVRWYDGSGVWMIKGLGRTRNVNQRRAPA